MADISNKVYEGKNERVSNMVKAMQGWGTSLATASEKPSGQFGRVVEITSGGVTITNELDIEFDVPFDDDLEDNQATITIYNLTNTTIKKFKADAVISITAGYGTDTGVIFVGVIASVKTKWSGRDRVTTIKATDSQRVEDQDIESISYNVGAKASYILKDLVGKLGLPIAAFKILKDISMAEGATVQGSLKSAIAEYAEICGVSVYINKRKVYVRPITDGDNTSITISSASGLIDSPEEFTEEVDNEHYTATINGVTFQMLLQHRITTASIITLESRDYAGKFRVRSGKHTCTDSEFTTEITAIDDEYRTTAKTSTDSNASGASNTESEVEKMEATETTKQAAAIRKNNWKTDRLANDGGIRGGTEQSTTSGGGGSF